MDTFSVNSNTKYAKLLIIIGFDKYYARMLELEGLDIGLPCLKFAPHFDIDTVKDSVENANECFAVINSDVVHGDGELFELIKFLNSACKRTAVICSHRVMPEANSFISENPTSICLFKRPVLIEELLSFLHKENEMIAPRHSEQIKIKVSRDTHSASFSGNVIYFTNKEFDILELLLNANGAPVSRKEIFNSVWKNEGEDSNIADVYIRYIRKKFSKLFNFNVIKTVRGIGYAVNTDIIWNWKL